MNRFEWVEATTVREAVDQLAAGATAKAGGVDLLDRMKERIEAPARLVNIRKVPGLDHVHDEINRGLRVGALVTLARLAESPATGRYPALAAAAGAAATPQIRNMATIGGNLLQRPRCWYFRQEEFNCLRKGGDTCFAQTGENEYHAIFGNEICAIVHPSGPATALVALGATVALTGPKGEREVRLEDFFVPPEKDVKREHSLLPGELLTEIRVPAPAAGTRMAYVKQREKESFDWPVADVAVVLEMNGSTCKRASIVLGAAAPVPRRALAAEKALVGKPITEETARAAAKSAVEGATPLSQNGYKVPVFEVVVRRTILAAAASKA
jgi:xanthine dehydrogenase YagS FAD-binding subunit